MSRDLIPSLADYASWCGASYVDGPKGRGPGRHCEPQAKQSTVSQVNSILNIWREFIIALSVVTSLRRTAMRAALCGFPLARRRS